MLGVKPVTAKCSRLPTAFGAGVLLTCVAALKLSGVMAEAIAFCFEVVARGTGLDGATLEIREIEGRARCLACGGEFAVQTLYAPCGCGSRRIVVLAGEELKIKTMELEETA